MAPRRKTAPTPDAPVALRYAGPADAAALARLAALEGGRVPDGPMLVAEVGGELWAAVALDGPDTLADPFRPSGELVLALSRRAGALRRSHDRALRPPLHRRWRRRLHLPA
jgi:hypothetical protein